ncbi:MAG TPA: (2Fe-2S)-binding protein [Gemmatimonadaceae bacterium]|jgi:aerobic-type carbon monoxide dehydrogenase small subunit (CoxS/CutS family)|nr:(2Fe-2S)-binding protein [Gemmatimonadaceae bacterium]
MRVIVNGAEHEVAAPGHETLLTTVRDRLDLTGTKLVCGRGECGACTVLVDGVSVYSCLTLTAACADHEITTVEGLAKADTLNRVQAAFIEHDALQCGFCTPGQIMAAVALLAENANPTEADVRQGMSGNLCRCGTYPKIVRAVLAAAEGVRDGEPANG